MIIFFHYNRWNITLFRENIFYDKNTSYLLMTSFHFIKKYLYSHIKYIYNLLMIERNIKRSSQCNTFLLFMYALVKISANCSRGSSVKEKLSFIPYKDDSIWLLAPLPTRSSCQKAQFVFAVTGIQPLEINLQVHFKVHLQTNSIPLSHCYGDIYNLQFKMGVELVYL